MKLSDARLAELRHAWIVRLGGWATVEVRIEDLRALLREVEEARVTRVARAGLVARAHNTSNVMAKFARGDGSLSPDDLREVSDLLRELGDFIDN